MLSSKVLASSKFLSLSSAFTKSNLAPSLSFSFNLDFPLFVRCSAIFGWYGDNSIDLLYKVIDGSNSFFKYNPYPKVSKRPETPILKLSLISSNSFAFSRN